MVNVHVCWRLICFYNDHTICIKVLVLKTVFIFRHTVGLILTTFIKNLLSLELYIRLFSRQINNCGCFVSESSSRMCCQNLSSVGVCDSSECAPTRSRTCGATCTWSSAVADTRSRPTVLSRVASTPDADST